MSEAKIFQPIEVTGFRREDLNNFPIGSYVKTMSADGSHFEPRSGSLNTILEVDHLRTIDWEIYLKILFSETSKPI
jgi:hypothetical protein